MEVSNVDIVQGWRSPVGRDKGPRYYYSRGLNAMLNAAFGMDLKDNKSGFILCAREVMEDLLVSRQLLLLAVVHHGVGARQGPPTKSRDAPENRRAGKRSSTTRTSKRWRAASSTSAGVFRISVPPQSPSTLRTFLDPASLVRDAPEPVWRRLYWRLLSCSVHALDDDQRGGQQLKD
jgi:phenylacetate-CoA ligase